MQFEEQTLSKPTRNLITYAPRSDGVPLSGESPARRDFPRQSHRVDARRDFSRRPHQTCWVPGTKIDLGLVIDIAQLKVIKCAHARNMLAR